MYVRQRTIGNDKSRLLILINFSPMSNTQCNGECRKLNQCTGEVRKVHVSGNGWGAPFEFHYCETAVQVDKDNGFLVKYVDENGLIESERADMAITEK